MKIIAIIAILLVATSFATKEEEFLSKIHKLESSKLGKTILDTLFLQVQTNGPVEDLIRMLQKKEDELATEQKADDQNINALQQECDGQLAQWESEIVGHNKRIKELGEKLTVWIPDRDEKVHSKEEKERRRAQIQERLAQLADEMAKKDAEWKEEQAQHQAVLGPIQQARAIIAKLVDGKGAPSAFLQTDATKAAFAQVSKIFSKQAKQHFKRPSWNSILNLFSQIAANAPIQASQGGVAKVLQLCDQLIDKIEQSLEIERRDYEHFKNAYLSEKTKLDDQVAKYTSQIDQLIQEIDVLNKKISTAQTEIKDNTQARDQKQALHDDKLNLCNQANVAYSERRQARHDQIDVVSDAVALLQSHLRLFRQYVSDRITNTVVKAK